MVTVGLKSCFQGMHGEFMDANVRTYSCTNEASSGISAASFLSVMIETHFQNSRESFAFIINRCQNGGSVKRDSFTTENG